MMREPLPDPRLYARQIAKENERRDLENNPNRLTSPLDLQTYLEKTNRGGLCRDISDYDKHLVDEALLNDLAKTDEPSRVKRLRNLSLTNLPETWMPKPDYPIEKVKSSIQRKLTESNRESWSKPSDEKMDNDNAYWTQLLKIISRGPSKEESVMDERALRFLEEKTDDLYGLMDEERPEGNRTRRASIDNLNLIRQAIYWRYLHSASEVPIENPFRT